MALLFVYLFVALVVSFLCSMLEAVLLSINASYIEALPEKKQKLQDTLVKLKANIDRPLSAILTLNTIAHTVGAAGVGAQAAIVFGEASLGIVSAILTLLILVLSELIPKTLGVNYWRSLVPFTAATLKIMILSLYPFVLMARGISKVLSKNEKEYSFSRDEMSAMADIGHKEGIFEESESRVVKNLIKLKIIKVEDIMTPRTVVVAVSEDMTLKELYTKKKYLRFSRIPIYAGQKDHVTGYIHKHDLLDKLANDQHDLQLSAIKRDIMMIPEETSISALFEKFLEGKEQVALAIDTYGGMAGLVSMEDVMETLLGIEITDEFDDTQDMQFYARERWRTRAKELGILPINEETPSEQTHNTQEDVIINSTTGGTKHKE